MDLPLRRRSAALESSLADLAVALGFLDLVEEEGVFLGLGVVVVVDFLGVFAGLGSLGVAWTRARLVEGWWASSVVDLRFWWWEG